MRYYEVVQGMERKQGDVQNNLSRYGEGLPKEKWWSHQGKTLDSGGVGMKRRSVEEIQVCLVDLYDFLDKAEEERDNPIEIHLAEGWVEALEWVLKEDKNGSS